MQYINQISIFGEKQGWERLQSEFRGEIINASNALGRINALVLLLKNQMIDRYTEFAQWHQAEQLQLEVLQVREETLGTEDIQTIHSRGALAEIYRHQSRLQEAQRLQRQIQETMTEWNIAYPYRYTNEHNLALTYAQQEQWEKSDKLLEKVINQRNSHNGPGHPNTLNSRLCLARNYADRGEWDRAEKIENDVLHITERTQGPEHPDTFYCIINLATTYRDIRHLEKIEKLQVAALDKARLVLGSEHHFTVTLMRNLAKTYSLQSQIPNAIKLQEEVVNAESLHSQTDSDASSELATMYEANGQFDDAISCRKQRLAILKDSANFSYLDTIMEMTFLADLHWTQGHHHEAFDMMHAALEDAEKDEDPAMIEGLKTCISQRLVTKPNGDQAVEIIDLSDIIASDR